jgi:hypothetical protein
VRVQPFVGPVDPYREEAIRAALTDLDAGSEALMAYRRGDDSYEADAGAFLLALALRRLTGEVDL